MESPSASHTIDPNAPDFVPVKNELVSETEHSDGEGAQSPNEGSNETSEKKSVKYLTCYYWFTNGFCKKSEEECLYSHHDTGMYADRPRPARPGGPMVAGRNARFQGRGRQHSGGQYGFNQYPRVAGAYNGQQDITSSPYGKQFAFIPSSVEGLKIDDSGSTANAAKAEQDFIDLTKVSSHDQPLPPVTTSIPFGHERRLTVGANRPSMSPNAPFNTPTPSARFSGQPQHDSPQSAPPHPHGSTSGPTNKNHEGGDSLFAMVQTTRVARRLDQTLCEVMRGLVNVSKDVHSAQKFDADGNGDLQVVQKRIRELFVDATKGRDEARALAKDGLHYGEIFETKVVE